MEFINQRYLFSLVDNPKLKDSDLQKAAIQKAREAKREGGTPAGSVQCGNFTNQCRQEDFAWCVQRI